MNLKFVYIFILFLVTQSVLAQGDKDFHATSNAKESLRIAERLMNKGKFEAAAKQFEHTIKIKDNFAVAHRLLGKVYLEMGEYKKAITAYEHSFEIDDKLSRAALFECGEAYFKLGDPELAMYFFNRYEKMKDLNYTNVKKESGLEITYDLMLKERKENCQYVLNLDKSMVMDEPFRLGKNINSKYDEYLPSVTSDGQKLIFTRKRKDQDEDIYLSKKENNQWKKGKAYGNSLNTDKNEGMARFEMHGKAFYFSGCMRSDTEGGCDIYKATLQKDDVIKVTRLEGHLNSHEWDSQPSISCDGTKMFFASTREGGHGGGDIYLSSLLPNGEWGVATNLGSVVNTEGDEEAPFIANDGKTLYFSSNGHPGQGDGDLFISRFENGQWTTPINLGYPINSTGKEIGMYVQGNGKTAYFASERIGGTGGLDIYTFELPEDLRPIPIVHLEGFVLDKNTKAPIATKVSISNSDENFTAYSDETGWFFLCVPGDKGYSFQINQQGYEYFIDAQFLDSQDNTSSSQVTMELVPKNDVKTVAVRKGSPIREKRVQFFFDFDSYELTVKAQNELKELSKLLNREKDWKVEVVGYADKTGSAAYNKKLSEKRAKSIVNFLEKYEVSISKVIKTEGLGAIAGSPYDNTGSQSRRVDVVLRKL
ncbi:MAG TPA: tetratricopeptide repeat protein [Phaeodactylibacter sp.]|nr:tetratricopeptide repeat protein [Phaeodactylibacter sp.]